MIYFRSSIKINYKIKLLSWKRIFPKKLGLKVLNVIKVLSYRASHNWINLRNKLELNKNWLKFQSLMIILVSKKKKFNRISQNVHDQQLRKRKYLFYTHKIAINNNKFMIKKK